MGSRLRARLALFWSTLLQIVTSEPFLQISLYAVTLLLAIVGIVAKDADQFNEAILAVLGIMAFASLTATLFNLRRARHISQLEIKIGALTTTLDKQVKTLTSTYAIMEKNKVRSYRHFQEGMRELLRQEGHIQSIDLFGSTSARLVEAIGSSDVHIASARLLVLDPDPDAEYDFPADTVRQTELKRSTNASISKWQTLCANRETPRIEQLALRHYNFHPPFMLVIVDHRIGLLSIFEYKDTHPYLVPGRSYILTDKSDYHREILRDLQAWFDYAYEHLSWEPVHPGSIANGAKQREPRVHDNWEKTNTDMWNTIRAAKHSIEIFDTWIGLWALDLRTALSEIKRGGDNKLKLSVYMCDPDGPFGAQRLKELDVALANSLGQDSEAVLATYQNFRDVTGTGQRLFAKSFRDQYDHSINQLLDIDKLLSDRLSLEIYTYPVMPVLKAIVVDGEEYFFTWFPLGQVANAHVCIHVSNVHGNSASKSLCTKLYKELEALKKRSRPHSISLEAQSDQ